MPSTREGPCLILITCISYSTHTQCVITAPVFCFPTCSSTSCRLLRPVCGQVFWMASESGQSFCHHHWHGRLYACTILLLHHGMSSLFQTDCLSLEHESSLIERTHFSCTFTLTCFLHGWGEQRLPQPVETRNNLQLRQCKERKPPRIP